MAPPRKRVKIELKSHSDIRRFLKAPVVGTEIGLLTNNYEGSDYDRVQAREVIEECMGQGGVTEKEIVDPDQQSKYLKRVC